MTSEQQDQALSYFRGWADDWQAKATGRARKYNVIEGRNNAVLDVLTRLEPARRFLDAGCGTGQLAIAAAERGIEAEGLDFSPEMIAHCERNCQEAGATATFTLGSVLELDRHPRPPLDAISALGLIEYISSEEMEAFFAQASGLLRTGGAFLVGSRNRLFNLFSLNAFTELEKEMGTIPALLDESLAMANGETALASLERAEQVAARAGYVHPQRHPHTTGIEVAVRYQYTPGDLVLRLRRHGFVPNAIYPVHHHGLPAVMKDDFPDFHVALAETMGRSSISDSRLVPQSSTFVLDVRKV